MRTMIVRAALAVAVAALVATTAPAKPYAQLSSTETQPAGAAPKAVTLNSTDSAKGITNTNGVVKLPEAGTYFVIAAGQVGSTNPAGKGTVRLWMRQNGKDVDNSNTVQKIEPGGFTAVLVCQGVVEAKADDKIELMISSGQSDQGLGLIVKKPAGEPVIPSMIFTAFKVGDTGYAQLSSTETQAADGAPHGITLNSTDAAKGIENAKGIVTLKEPGVYFVIAAGQVGATAQDGKGSVKLWMKQNGKDVDNSNTEQTVTEGYTAVLVCQGVVEAKGGDKLELIESATGKGVGMVASKPAGEPVVPSMIFTAFKVGDTGYAQLSSTETQGAADAPKPVTLNSTDAAKGIENAKGVVTVKDAGAYFVIAAGQVGASSPEGKGSVKLWARQNGKDVDNSNTEQTVTPGFTAVLVCQGIVEAKAGDKVELAQSATGKGVGLVMSKPGGEPVIPSMIFSAFRID
ncbi:MAG: exported protein of unknown function [Gemmataceae bacterium]|nr:exported protein of unknown function [Gemmataceae bacterium]